MSGRHGRDQSLPAPATGVMGARSVLRILLVERLKRAHIDIPDQRVAVRPPAMDRLERPGRLRVATAQP
ncbi:MAG: hypothetical protein ACK583_04850 [Cyanobacteriota bacterium]